MFDFLSGFSASFIETLPLIPAAIGFYIALRALKFPDLTVEGSFVFGSVISAIFIQNEFSPYIAILVSIGGGMLCGALTAFWNTKLKIPPFASGIITTFIMTFVNYSILKQLSYNNSQITILSIKNKGVFEYFKEIDHSSLTWGQYNLSQIGFIIIIILITITIVFLLLKSNFGLQLRAFGSDRKAGNIYKKKYYYSIVTGLAFTNGLVALSGSIVAQLNSSVNLTKGASLLIPLLAAVVFGEFFVVFLREKAYRKNAKVIKPILSRPFGLAIAPSLGFLFYNMIVLIFSAIILPFTKLESFHKYWVIAIAMILILALKKADVSEKYTDDLI